MSEASEGSSFPPNCRERLVGNPGLLEQTRARQTGRSFLFRLAFSALEAAALRSGFGCASLSVDLRLQVYIFWFTYEVFCVVIGIILVEFIMVRIVVWLVILG